VDIQYDFDFQKRKKELETIVAFRLNEVKSGEVIGHIQGMSMSIMGEINLLVDEGHPKNNETIKRNFDFAKYSGAIVGEIGFNAFCVGFDFGIKRIQDAPVRSGKEIPMRAKEYFVVILEPAQSLFLKLISDIYATNGLDETGTRVRQDRFNKEAFGFLLACYRLGVAYGKDALPW